MPQTAIICGDSGENGAKQYLESERKRQNSVQKGQMDTRAATHKLERVTFGAYKKERGRT